MLKGEICCVAFDVTRLASSLVTMKLQFTVKAHCMMYVMGKDWRGFMVLLL